MCRYALILMASVLGLVAFDAPALAKTYKGISYSTPVWLDNEHILCVKEVHYSKSWLFRLEGDLSDSPTRPIRDEIQLVSIHVDSGDEALLKNIVIRRPGGSYQYEEKIFKGVLRIEGLACNPHRRLIAFSSTQGFFIMGFDGTGMKKIAEQGYLPRFSPDGRTLQYTSKNQVWLYDLETGEHRLLLDNALGGPFSPDSRWIHRLIAGDYRTDFKRFLQIVDVSTGKGFTLEDATSVNWSSNGSHFTYTTQQKTDQGNETILYLCQITEDQLKTLHSIPNTSGGLWSAGGEWIAAKDLTDGSILLLSPQANERRVLLRPSVPYLLPQAHRTAGEPRVQWFSPGPWLSHERLLVYSMENVESKSQQTILVVDVHTSSILFRHVLKESCTDQQLSPDGKNLLFRDGKKLKALIENGSRIVELVEM